MNLKPRFDRPRGVTLVELMVVIAVAGILAAVTAPSIGNAMKRERQRSVVSGVANHMREARNQAMARGEAVTITVFWDGGGSTPGWIETRRNVMQLADGTTQLGTTNCDSSAAVDTCPDGSLCMENKCWGRPPRSCRELASPHTSLKVAEFRPPDTNSGIRLGQYAGGVNFCFGPDGRAERVGGGLITGWGAGPSGSSCPSEGYNVWIADRDYSTSMTTVLSKMRCDSTAVEYEEVGGAVVRIGSNGEIGVRSPKR